MFKCEIKNNYILLFAQNGLKSFQDIFSFDKGEIVDKNRKRSVIKFTLYDPSCGTDRIFYLKRFYANTLRENVYSIFEWGYPKSEAKTEWDNAQILVKEGFLTIPCVAYGEHKKWGIIKQSFFISEEIPQSEPLDQLYETLNDTIRQNVPRTLGNLIKALHEKHISFPDLYTKHLFINKGDLLLEKITVSLIDLHRMRQKKRLSNTDKIRDLAALLFTLESLLSPAEIGALVHSYMSGRAITQRWNNLLAKRIERLKKRRSTERGILIRQSGDSNTAVYVNEEYYPYFEAHNLLSYNELFNYQTEKRKFTDNPGRTVQRFVLRNKNTRQAFFIKKHTPVKKRFSVKKIISYARNEWNSHLLCKKLYINVPIPVAWGYSKAGVSSFIITAELENNIPLDVALQESKITDIRMKTALIKTIAFFARSLHTAGYCHKDFYTGHILIKKDGENKLCTNTVFLIDLQRIQHLKLIKRRWFVKDLAQLNFSAQFPTVSVRDKIAFLHEYFSVSKLTAAQRKCMKKIDLKTQKIYAHIPKVLRRKNIHSWDEIPHAEEKVKHSV